MVPQRCVFAWSDAGGDRSLFFREVSLVQEPSGVLTELLPKNRRKKTEDANDSGLGKRIK
jgi:hypothetical protein